MKAETEEMKIFEILTYANSRKNVKEAKKFLKENENFGLKVICQLSYHPNVTFVLPEGKPPYDPNKTNEPFSSLENEIKLLSSFIKETTSDNISLVRVESQFIALLERIPHTDAEILLLVKDKKLQTKFKKLSRKMITEVWPDLFPPDFLKEVANDIDEESKKTVKKTEPEVIPEKAKKKSSKNKK